MLHSLISWFKKNGRDLPWRRRRDPYAVLVSEMMLQQTQVVTVIDYFERWIARFPNFHELAAAHETEVLHAWQGLGYYSRARNLHRTAKLVMERHAGEFPHDLKMIRALPGIGPYTAGAIASFAFDQSTPVVDGNIARVLARLYNYRDRIDSSTGQKWVWQVSTELQPKTGAGFFNEALMELGATICLPGRPQCEKCPISSFCKAEAPETLPIKKPRQKTVAMEENCVWIFKNGQVLLEQQTGVRWHGLWKLPLLTESLNRRIPNGSTSALFSLDYPFTHHRVTLTVFEGNVPRVFAENQEWFRVDQIEAVAMTAPHRRALNRIMSDPSPPHRLRNWTEAV